MRNGFDFCVCCTQVLTGLLDLELVDVASGTLPRMPAELRGKVGVGHLRYRGKFTDADLHAEIIAENLECAPHTHLNRLLTALLQTGAAADVAEELMQCAGRLDSKNSPSGDRLNASLEILLR